MNQHISKYLTEEEQRTLLGRIAESASILAQRDHAWICLLRDTGLRITEFSVSTVKDAKAWLKNGRIFIPKEFRKGGKRDLDIALFEAGREHVQTLLRCCAAMARCTVEQLLKDDPLVRSRKNQPLSVRAYQQRIALWAARAGLGLKVSPHWLRHTRAMNIMRRSTHKDPRALVQIALAHADIRSTGIYTLPSREEVERELLVVEGPVRVKRGQLRKLYDQGLRA